MKKLLLLFVLVSSIPFYAQKKIYFTKDFIELPSQSNATYYSIYEPKDKGTVRTTFYINDSIYSKDYFSNYRRMEFDGTSERWYPNGKKESLAIYIKGKQEGIQTRYFENGQIKRTENFKNGEFVDGKCLNEDGAEIEFFPYDVKTEFPGGNAAFFTYMQQNLKVPFDKSTGQVIIDFEVQIDGSLNNFHIIKSVKKEIDLAVIRTLVNGPKWIPGKIDGKVTVMKYKLPVTLQFSHLKQSQIVKTKIED